MEFWNDMATDRSWDALIRLKEVDFILIGGWACYLLTRSIKSKDIDIIVDFDALGKLKRGHRIKKTPFLKKYEMVVKGTSVDIYVPFYSRLAVPIEYIQRNSISIEGFKIPRPEILLVLKQAAEMERRYSVKGQKDRVDILNLLINSPLDMKEYWKITRQFGLRGYPRRLREIITSASKEFDYLGMKNLRRVKITKEKLRQELRG